MLSECRRKRVLKLRSQHEHLLQYEVGRMRDAGLMRSDLSVRILTLALLNMLNWTVIWYRDDGFMKPEDVAASLATIFLQGATPQGVISVNTLCNDDTLGLPQPTPVIDDAIHSESEEITPELEA